MHFSKYKHKYYALIMAVVLILADFFTKIAAVEYMPKETTVKVIPYLINFRFLYNDGAAFGMLDNARWVFMLATTVFIVAGIIYFIALKPKNIFLGYVIMLILAGGIGNMIDRVTTGQVVDFVTFDFIDFPSFNVADCCVVIGCILWILYILFDIFKGEKETK